MLCLKINRKQVWGKPTEEIRSQNYEKIEAINAKTTYDKSGHDGPQDQAAYLKGYGDATLAGKQNFSTP
jgi:hypothetical protein